MITFTNLTGTDDIGANSYLLDLEGSRIVLDAGMHPKKDGNEAKPDYKLIGGRPGLHLHHPLTFRPHRHPARVPR